MIPALREAFNLDFRPETYQQFLKDNAIRSVVDAGCGDWEFSQAIDWTGIDYKGARLPLSPRFNFAVGANYNFDITEGYTGDINVTDHYVGDRTSGFAGSPISPAHSKGAAWRSG